MPTSITFVVPGVRSVAATRGGPGAPAPLIGRLKESVSVAAVRSAAESEVTVTATPGEDVVVIQIAGGPALYLHPESARDLFLAQQDPFAMRGGTEVKRAPGEVAVPVRMRWRLEDSSPARGAARGFLGDVLVRGIQIVTGLTKDRAADFAASAVVKKVDAQVDPGVYRLDAHRLSVLKGTNCTSIEASDAPSLVLIHGTFSQTAGTFGKLWVSYPQLVRSLFGTYGNRVYALDHPTLGASPIANAITLAEAAPANAKLHLLTHSRGGLVAEVLARVCASPASALAGFPAFAGNSIQELKRLAAIVATKRLSVDRIVRVACPARGTLLASKRLDAYVSVLKWALDLAQVPVVPELVEFLGEVARRRADPDTVPGLAAQIPDSPFINWLHAERSPISGTLRVVSGDMQGDSVATWVKTLLSDAFYWTDNDLVVQTRSMYGGTPRNESSTFLLDQGGKVSHFSYFSNPHTATAIVSALIDESPEGFRVIGPLSWGGTSSTGARAPIIARTSEQAAALPAVFLLPGIFGSNLKAANDRIWLGSRLVNGFDRLAYDAADGAVTPDGLIGAYYDDLAAFLAVTHDVKPFAFDWRRPILDQARRLAREVNAALDARKKSRTPVRIVAHSTGGLVARAMQIVSGPTWNRMMDIEGARVLMLGTPNHGSWAPMQVLSGDDTFRNLLTAVGAPFRADAIRQLMADFPGLVELQAGLLDGLDTESAWSDLAKADLDAMRTHSVWHRLPLQLAQYQWGMPAQAVLDGAVKLRRILDRQRDVDLPSFAQKLLLVVGTAPLTPAKYKLTKNGVVYLDAVNQGDGRVLLESALLPGVATWMVDADHGTLPRRKDAFEGYRELLANGTTAHLKRLVASKASRGAASDAPTMVLSRPARMSTAASPPQRETELMTHAGDVDIRQPESAAAALRLTIVNGDLTYIPEPLLIGHYRALLLSGAEAVMDRAIGGAMSASLRHGLYPNAPGSHQVFINSTTAPDNPWQLPRPHAVIVAGLGAEGELRGTELAMSVRQAVVAWAQRLTEHVPVPTVCSLATTLLGSGGTGVTAGQAAQLIAQGVQEANELLAGDGDTPRPWPRIDRLTMVELYLDRASEAWNALQALVASAAHRFRLDPVVERGVGAIERPAEAGYRGADYDFISALTSNTDEGGQQIVYTVNTRRARSDVRPQATQVPLIRSLVSSASNSASSDTQVGRTLFSLLIPPDLEPFLGSSTETVLELDEGTAAIPWEVLEPPHSRRNDSPPWSIRTKLLRKLRMSTPDFTPSDAGADDSILVIGDPACDRSRYPVLPGARREAEEVAACLMRAIEGNDEDSAIAAKVRSVISGPGPEDEPDANAVVNAVMEQPWRIIHIAAHGEPPEELAKNPDPRGVVLSGERTYLGPREIAALRVIPELVFVNCCHLATSGAQVLGPANYDRARFASGVAHALIKGGVRCVIAAGWAVDDDAASKFAATFYDALLGGARFIDAVAAARVDARACGGNTWASYQCYGDPEWRFRRTTGDAQRPAAAVTASPAQEFATIASAPALLAALERIAVKSNFQGADPGKQADRLRYLEAVHAPFWQHRGDMAEAFATAWASTGFLDDAIRWYERARDAQDGSASLAAIEQLADVRIRAAWSRFEKTGRTASAVTAARREIGDALALLDTFSGLGLTFEREDLYGSSYKRLALLEATAGRDAAASEAIQLMRQHYSEAEKIARAAADRSDPKAPPLFRAAIDRIAAQLALADPRTGAEPMDAATIEAIRASMASAVPDFWSVVGQTELDMYVAASQNGLAKNLDDLLRAFTDHHALVPSSRMWSSVLDRAQFVLWGYRKRSDQTEVDAVNRIFAHLMRLAGRASPAKSGVRQSAKRKSARKNTHSKARSRTRPRAKKRTR